MKFMRGNNQLLEGAGIAREARSVADEFVRVLQNTLNTASEGLLSENKSAEKDVGPGFGSH